MQFPKESLRLILLRPTLIAMVVVMVVGIGAAIATRPQEAQDKMIERARYICAETSAIWAYAAEGETNPASEQCPFEGANIGNRIMQAASDDLKLSFVVDSGSQAYPEIVDSFRTGQQSFAEISDRGGERWFTYAQPVFVGEACAGCHDALNSEGAVGAVVVSFPTEQYDRSARNYMFFDISFMAFLLAMCLITIWVPLRKYVTQPMEKLEQATACIDLHEHGSRINAKEINARGELGKFVDRFNLMAKDIEESYFAVESQVEERTRELAAANAELVERQLVIEKLNGELRRESDYKSDFLATMSHEIKTPMTSVLANMELLKGMLSREMTPEVEAVFEDMSSNSKTMLRLIEQILDAARLDAGRMPLNIEPADIWDVIGAVDAMADALAREGGIEYRSHVQDDIPILRIDVDKIMKIAMNLVSNAVKFTPEGGHVELTMRYDCNSERLILQIRDDGIGLQGVDQDKIFDRFFQGDQSISRTYGGTGIGLSLVKEFAELHGGSARGEQLERGSLFTVEVSAQPIDLEEL